MTENSALTAEHRSELTKTIESALAAMLSVLPPDIGAALVVDGIAMSGTVSYTSNISWERLGVLLRQCALSVESSHLEAPGLAVSAQVAEATTEYVKVLLKDGVDRKVPATTCIFGALRFAAMLIESPSCSSEIKGRCQQLADEIFFLATFQALNFLSGQSLEDYLKPVPVGVTDGEQVVN